jgi:hypothetical protein
MYKSLCIHMLCFLVLDKFIGLEWLHHRVHVYICFFGGTFARQALYYLSHSASPFVDWVFFKIGSCEQFAQVGFELCSY